MKNVRLIEARKLKGLTQEQMALKLGYKGRQAVANWENGHAVPPLNIAIEISKLLDTKIDFLFGYKVQDACIDSSVIESKQSNPRKEVS